MDAPDAAVVRSTKHKQASQRKAKQTVSVSKMEVRKLDREEHIRTRKLWEEIFTEDTPEFLDYYYSVKTADNEIYVIEDCGEIVSMLHLNPYQMRIGEQIHQTHYIVAVATDERYRKQGLMRQLLNHAMQVMADRGEPFTFLMPASEAIYKPFGFEFIYTQGRARLFGKETVRGQGTLKGCRATNTSTQVEKATKKDCQELADFANNFLKTYDVVTWRTAGYYQTLLAELESEHGGILLVRKNSELRGFLCYAKGEEIEIREPIFYKEEDLRCAIYHLTGSETEPVLCIGYGNEEGKPMIMAKVLSPEFEMNLKNAKVFLNEVV